MKQDKPLNAFEVFFDEAVQGPERIPELERWIARQPFIVPCELASPAPADLVRADREVRLAPSTRIRLKAFRHGEQAVVPFFSELARFEAWSAPDPQGRFTRLDGRTLFRLVPGGGAALLNPGSERFSKWFTSEEVARISQLA